jgi:hypothetical protein
MFIDSLEKDIEPPINADNVLSAMRAVFASIESSEKGKTITIDKNRR